MEAAKANMNWVTDTLATGGDLSYDPTEATEQAADIIAQGVTCIIDMRAEDNDSELWAEAGIDYLHLPTNDAYGHHIERHLLDAAVLKAREATADGGKVFVHCHMGVNRGPSVAYAILLDQGMGHIAAYDLIREKRSQAGLYYAMDALKAEQARSPQKGLSFWYEQQIDFLTDHIADVWTDDELNRIQHVIREGHRQDASVRARVGYGW